MQILHPLIDPLSAMPVLAKMLVGGLEYRKHYAGLLMFCHIIRVCIPVHESRYSFPILLH